MDAADERDLYRRLLVAALLGRVSAFPLELDPAELAAADRYRLIIDRDQDGRVTVEVREREPERDAAGA